MRSIDADKLKKHYAWWKGSTRTLTMDEAKSDFDVIVDLQPTIEAEPRWIPVTEKLPEEDTDVLICYRYKQGEGDPSHVDIDITSYGTVCFGGRAIHFLKEWRQPFEYFHANYEVVAWMPLPEPYREVEG